MQVGSPPPTGPARSACSHQIHWWHNLRLSWESGFKIKKILRPVSNQKMWFTNCAIITCKLLHNNVIIWYENQVNILNFYVTKNTNPTCLKNPCKPNNVIYRQCVKNLGFPRHSRFSYTVSCFCNKWLFLHEISHQFCINTKPVFHKIAHTFEISNFLCTQLRLNIEFKSYFLHHFAMSYFLHEIGQCYDFFVQYGAWIRKYGKYVN